MECKKCGECCKYVFTHLAGLSWDRKWVEGRDGQVVGDVVLLPCRCKWLKPDNTCEVQDNKPRYCKNFPSEMSSIVKALGCRYFEE